MSAINLGFRGDTMEPPLERAKHRGARLAVADRGRTTFIPVFCVFLLHRNGSGVSLTESDAPAT
jgi:hypothetical protein